MIPTDAARVREVWLLAATFLVAVSGLIYELIAATLSSYLLGDSVRQFSLVIGVFLFSMGVGAWLSRYVGRATQGFVWTQILLGVVGGFLAPVAFVAYGWLGDVQVLLYTMLMLVGVLSGMEIPLIARILKQIGAPEFRFENVLSVDYVGALVAAVAFPLLVIPHLGLMSASLAFGALNLAVAGISLWLFRDETGAAPRVIWALAFAGCLAGLVQSERLVSVAEAALYENDVILAEQTPYQRITVTQFQDRTRLFLDGAIQFDTVDEYRYHEMLVHPAMVLAPRAANVLILGGGDGMAAREVLRHQGVEAVTLVDLDPRVTQLFRQSAPLAQLNAHSLSDPRVTILNQDAWKFIEDVQQVFDVIIVDLPDPKNVALSRLYTREFYSLLAERLAANGLIVTQSGSPMFAREAFWSVERTLAAAANPVQPGAGLRTLAYHVYVPSFGDWGFVIAAPTGIRREFPSLPSGLRYLTAQGWAAAQIFSPDSAPLPVQVNTIQSHALLAYYLDGWDRWFQ
ncbi:spermidine synthase [Monaibacterium marinum]|uniref:Polyamine aminopropyltransferase n=1 Tax=Pontivivens marinum TaxID=1690039 RepID=A0A2C9CQ02_9RHOB|nr:polyamine aminopropyltransferase [Monaibacterium marinum]SOH93300.1 spermidine synthase [Monaibacterium marinum]